MPDQRDETINFIRTNGPVLPVQIAKHVNTNILFASAILSELVDRRMLKITSASIGGSPLYYLAGQEEQMDSRLCLSLGGREKEAYNLLKDNKVLWEKSLEPWQRVAVKSLKDFAVQISVNINGNIENFWKHGIVNDEEAKQIISSIMDEVYPKETIPEVIEETKVEPVQETIIQKPEVMEVQQQIVKPELVKQSIIEDASKIEEVIDEPEEIFVKQKEPKKEKKIDTKFYSNVLDFMKHNKVEVLKEEIIKKDKEIDFIVNISTAFGKLKYLIKAKNKALINEADISVVFSEGQIKKMPIILLHNGKVNKKAALLVEQKMQGLLVLKEI